MNEFEGLVSMMCLVLITFGVWRIVFTMPPRN
jgi:hypothetical protein